MKYIDRNICVAQIPKINGIYGYRPSEAVGVAFCVLFGLSIIGHVFATIRRRVWWQSIFAIGALVETIGWTGRAWSSKCPYQNTPFLMQITTLILAPTFFTAGIYVILGQLIRTFGPEVSPIAPKMYLYIFCTVDFTSLVVQAVGGALASFAFQKVPMQSTAVGTHIMVAGVLFQLASIIVFVMLFTKVILKATRSRSAALRNLKIKLVIGATVVSVSVIVIRSIYRTVELLQGWTGYLMTHEAYFVALDGAMMVLAVCIFNIVQPSWAKWEEAKAPGVRVYSDFDGDTEMDTMNPSTPEPKDV